MGCGTSSCVVRIVVDVHEDYTKLLADRAWARGLRAVAARAFVGFATRLAGGTDLTVVADEHLPPWSARHRVVVPNLPSAAFMPPVADRDPVPRAVYIGDLRESRGLFDMVEAIGAAPGWQPGGKFRR